MSLRRALMSPHRAPISSHRMVSVRVFHDVLLLVHDVLLRFTMYYNVLHVFHDVLLCLTMF